jgi:penicillin-binding protein 1B
MKVRTKGKKLSIKSLIFAPFRWMKRHFLKLILLFIVLICAYFVYIDAQIQPRFEGNKWQVPAQIYARPLTLDVKQEITIKEVVDELRLLGYRKKSSSKEVGEYSQSANSLVIYRREFNYPNTLPSECKLHGMVLELRLLKCSTMAISYHAQVWNRGWCLVWWAD